MGVKLTNCWKWRNSTSRPTKPTKRTLVRLSLTLKRSLSHDVISAGGAGRLFMHSSFLHFIQEFRKKQHEKKTISKFSSSSSPVCSCLSEVSQPPEKLEFFLLSWNLAVFPSICSTSGEFMSSHLCMDSICSCLWLWLSVWVHVWLLPWNSGKETLRAANVTYDIVYAICWYMDTLYLE